MPTTSSLARAKTGGALRSTAYVSSAASNVILPYARAVTARTLTPSRRRRDAKSRFLNLMKASSSVRAAIASVIAASKTTASASNKDCPVTQSCVNVKNARIWIALNQIVKTAT